MFQLLNALKNPQAFMNQMKNNSQMMQNPMIRNAMDMYQRGDSKGLQNMAENLCRERGISPQEFQESLKKQLGL
jgi:methylphosphotriester-DNA--protein-cysteine methyltransferase